MNKSDPSSPGKAPQSGPATIVTPLSRHRRKERGAADSATVSPGDEMRLASLKESIEQLPAIDATRVVRLHHRIIAGDYEIDSGRLAEKLLSLESLLGRD